MNRKQEDYHTVSKSNEDIASQLFKMDNAVLTTKPPEKFSVWSWNLGGLDERNLKRRTKAVVKILDAEKPDIVFLQEVIPKTYSYFEEKLPYYLFVAGGTTDYFTATLLCQFTTHFDDHEILSFRGTSMNRNLLVVECHIGGLDLKLLNAHLESTAPFHEERKKQLKQCFQEMKTDGKTVASIFGGDLNLRDEEVMSVGLPSKTADLWEMCGSRKECRYTWDAMRNTNIEISSKFRPRARFDRLYFRNSESPAARAIHFGLTGIQKVSQTQSFPSDHWGICTYFNIVNQQMRVPGPPPSKCGKVERDAISSPITIDSN